MSLTETGQRFYQRCRVILAEVDAADALGEDVDARPHGRLRMSAPVGYGACRFAPIVAEFLELHPEMEVELTLTDRYVDLVDEGYDAVLRLGPIGKTSLIVREFAAHSQMVCAAPDYLRQFGIPQVPGDLVNHACLGFVNWSGRPFAEWRFGRDGVIHSVRLHSRFQVNDGRVLVAAAVAGHGLVLQPEAVLADALAKGDLVPILTDYVAPSRTLYLIYTAREPQPAKLKAFIDYVVAAVAIGIPT